MLLSPRAQAVLEVSKYTKQHSLPSWTLLLRTLVNVKTWIIKDSWYQQTAQWPESDSHHLRASQRDWGHCSMFLPTLTTDNDCKLRRQLLTLGIVINRHFSSAGEKPVSRAFVKIIQICQLLSLSLWFWLNHWGPYAANLKWTSPPLLLSSWFSFCWCDCDVCHQCMARLASD